MPVPPHSRQPLVLLQRPPHPPLPRPAHYALQPTLPPHLPPVPLPPPTHHCVWLQQQPLAQHREVIRPGLPPPPQPPSQLQPPHLPSCLLLRSLPPQLHLQPLPQCLQPVPQPLLLLRPVLPPTHPAAPHLLQPPLTQHHGCLPLLLPHYLPPLQPPLPPPLSSHLTSVQPRTLPWPHPPPILLMRSLPTQLQCQLPRMQLSSLHLSIVLISSLPPQPEQESHLRSLSHFRSAKHRPQGTRWMHPLGGHTPFHTTHPDHWLRT